MAKRINLAGKKYVIMLATEEYIKVRRSGDKEILTIWKSSYYYRILSRAYREARC